MEDLTKHYLISGRVQGVGYRAFAHRQAREFKLKGWVRNLNDGRVEVLALGSAEVLREFEQRLRAGPSGGQVETLTASIRKSAEEFAGFEVRKDGPKPCFES